MNIGFVLAGGTGQRFGASIPKQYMSLNGKLVIQYAIDSLYEAKIVDKIIVVANDEKMPGLKHVDEVIPGGSSRFDSVMSAIKHCPPETDIVVFQDAVRPFTPVVHYRKAMELLQVSPNLEFVVTAQGITDGLFRGENSLIEEGVNRGEFRHCQTPEICRYRSLKEIYEQVEECEEARKVNYICHLYDIMGNVGAYIELNQNNLKITYDYDLFIAEQLAKFARPNKDPNPSLHEKRILLLGATGDIGNALRVHLTCLGANVSCPPREIVNIAKLGETSLDMLDQEFDCVINCAGTYSTDKENYSTGLTKMMKTNFTGVVRLIDVSRKYWLKKGGNIVLLGSAAASHGRRGISVYSASKAALNTFVEAIKDNLAEAKIRINIICPAKVKGKLQMTINPNAKQEDMIDPEDLAKIITNYVATDETGCIVYVRNGQENDT